MGKRLAAIVVAGAFLSLPALAQTETAQDAPIDEIIVEGKRYKGGDRAMDAFFAGDFETAEIEFKRNIRILKRGRTQIEAASIDATSQDLNQIGSQTVTAGSQSAAGQIADGFTASTAPTDIRGGQSGQVVTSGTDTGFQHYMIGLSQLQLGKVLEAEDSFKSAIHHNSTLHDARMRLALIRLGKGDVDYARKQLAKLEKMSAKCKDRCTHRKELADSEALLRDLLANYQ